MVNKKGALELSINAIVIVILAMTLLGLGLGFVRGIFKNFSQGTDAAIERMNEQVMEDLRTGDKKLSFPSSDLDVRGEEIIVIGIKNTEPRDLGFSIVISTIIRDPATGLPADRVITSDPDLKTNVNPAQKYAFFWDNNPQYLAAGDSSTYVIKVKADRTQRGTSLFKISIMYQDLDEYTVEYASKTFFLNFQ